MIELYRSMINHSSLPSHQSGLVLLDVEVAQLIRRGLIRDDAHIVAQSVSFQIALGEELEIVLWEGFLAQNVHRTHRLLHIHRAPRSHLARLALDLKPLLQELHELVHIENLILDRLTTPNLKLRCRLLAPRRDQRTTRTSRNKRLLTPTHLQQTLGGLHFLGLLLFALFLFGRSLLLFDHLSLCGALGRILRTALPPLADLPDFLTLPDLAFADIFDCRCNLRKD